MELIDGIGAAINYIEHNITEDVTVADAAKCACISPFYFQKAFSMLCGFTVGEYIRRRRLTLAGSELVSTDEKIIDIALKYGYDSPDSFTKAFTRFHGVTPAAARKNGGVLKSFTSLKIRFTLEGGSIMDYKITDKSAFTVVGASKTFKYDGAKDLVPQFWKDFYKQGNGKFVCGMYGISFDKTMQGNEFEYLIADNYNPSAEVPEGFVTKTIPEHTWAVFPSVGAMPQSLQSVNEKIFSEWLPNCTEYEIAEGISVEMYDDPSQYKNGTLDEKYYSEIWIPVKKK